MELIIGKIYGEITRHKGEDIVRCYYGLEWGVVLTMKKNRTVFKIIGLISQLGLSVVVPIFLCTFIGMFLERRFSISITVILIVLGLLAGMRNAYYLLKQAVDIMKEDKDEED